jgi:hypothetical protein
MRNIILTIIALLAMHCNGYGQELLEPDFSQKPYYISKDKLAEFEKVDASMERKMKGMGYGGLEYFYSADGAKSIVRFPQSALPKIIIKSEDNSDPTEAFSISIAEVKKGSRRFKAMKMGAFGNVKNSTENKIKVSAKRLKDKIFEIVIDQTLTPGEYAIISNSAENTAKGLSTGARIFCFGID